MDIPPLATTTSTISTNHYVMTTTTGTSIQNSYVTSTTITPSSNCDNSNQNNGAIMSSLNIVRQNLLIAANTPTGASTSQAAGISSEAVPSTSRMQTSIPLGGGHYSAYNAYNATLIQIPQRLSPTSSFRIKRLKILKRQKIESSPIRPLHLPLPVNNSISADTPLPPNWNENMKDVSESLASYKLFPISRTTCEFRKFEQLLNPFVVCKIDQIVNPTVWTRFVNARKEMLKKKCSDPTVLMELGLSDEDIARKQQSINFVRHEAIDAAPYDDNFALLFHCTKDPVNVDYILREGFDERLAKGGLLGKGIYFSDEPGKSIGYDRCGGVIFICGVLLGDCLTHDWSGKSFGCPSTIGNLVKEPEKFPLERRYIDDNYFDSVHAYVNQYAVYNRNQCCPLYKVTYSVPESVSAPDNPLNCNKARFGWLANCGDYKLGENSTLGLHAKTIFDEIETIHPLEPIYGSASLIEESIDEKLAILMNLGFFNVELNLKTLKENDFHTERTVGVLSQRNIDETLKFKNELAARLAAIENQSASESEGSSYHSTTDEDKPKERQPSTSKTTPRKKPLPPPKNIEEDCSICCNKYAKTSNDWKTLPQCQHKLCVHCYRKIEITRTTMTGVSQTFMKCPFCLKTTGIEIGTCPDGEMTERISLSHCAGYEVCGTILLLYTVNTPLYHLRRAAYLPDNEEGRKVAKLLRIAWDRRIVFTVGTSHTTSRENALVWNIHHKTSQTGGVYCHGYPDDTYLQRVTAELKSFGIE